MSLKTFVKNKILKKVCFHKKNYIIAIDGGTGAGKTTLAEEIKTLIEDEDYKVVVLHIDDFINKREIRYSTKKEEWYCYYYLQWRYSYLIGEVLIPLRKNELFNKDIEIYDKEKDEYYLKKISVIPGTIILLEGVFLQRKELEGLFDVVVYIDVDRDKRLQRVLHRDTYIGNAVEIKNKYERRYLKAEDYYNDTYKPLKKADFVYKTGGL